MFKLKISFFECFLFLLNLFKDSWIKIKFCNYEEVLIYIKSILPIDYKFS